MCVGRTFPVSLFGPWNFPFSLLVLGAFPSPHPPNLFSNFSWAYRYFMKFVLVLYSCWLHWIRTNQHVQDLWNTQPLFSIFTHFFFEFPQQPFQACASICFDSRPAISCDSPKNEQTKQSETCQLRFAMLSNNMLANPDTVRITFRTCVEVFFFLETNYF